MENGILDHDQVRQVVGREHIGRLLGLKGRPKIGAHDPKGSGAEKRQSLEYAAAGIQSAVAFIAINDLDAEAAAVSQILANLRTEPSQVDHDAIHARCSQPLDVVLDERLA